MDLLFCWLTQCAPAEMQRCRGELSSLRNSSCWDALGSFLCQMQCASGEMEVLEHRAYCLGSCKELIMGENDEERTAAARSNARQTLEVIGRWKVGVVQVKRMVRREKKKRSCVFYLHQNGSYNQKRINIFKGIMLCMGCTLQQGTAVHATRTNNSNEAEKKTGWFCWLGVIVFQSGHLFSQQAIHESKVWIHLEMQVSIKWERQRKDSRCRPDDGGAAVMMFHELKQQTKHRHGDSRPVESKRDKKTQVHPPMGLESRMSHRRGDRSCRLVAFDPLFCLETSKSVCSWKRKKKKKVRERKQRGLLLRVMQLDSWSRGHKMLWKKAHYFT